MKKQKQKRDFWALLRGQVGENGFRVAPTESFS